MRQQGSTNVLMWYTMCNPLAYLVVLTFSPADKAILNINVNTA